MTERHDSRLKVLHAVPSGRISGVTFRVMTVAEELSTRGIDNVVVSPDDRVESPGYVDGEDIQTRRAGFKTPTFPTDIWSVFSNVAWLFNVVFSVVYLVRLYAEENPDVVHVNGLTQIQPGIAAWLCRKKVVWHLISDFYPHWALFLFMPLVSRIADAKIVICEPNREYYFPDGKWDYGDVHVVTGTIRTDAYGRECVTDAEIEDVYETYDVSPDDLVLTTISGINRNKGQHKVIEAMARIEADVTYLVVGPRTDRQYINKLEADADAYGLKDSIVFTGTITEKKDAILAAADVFVLASSGEGTPLSIMEAMAMEIPVIASAVGGVPNMLHDGEAGIVVPPDLIDAIAAAIDRYENESLRTTHGTRGREIVTSEYDVSIIADQHVKIYENVRDQ